MIREGEIPHYKDTSNNTSFSKNTENNITQNDAESSDVAIPHLERVKGNLK